MSEFEAWVQGRALQLARTAYLLTGDTHRAEDLLQETLARVAERWDSLARRGTPDGYARQVMYHLSVDWWRRRQARPELLVEQPLDGAGDSPDQESVVSRLVLREALLRLTPRQRAVLVLRFFDDCTETQAADLLGCSVNTVKSQTRHALGRLRQLAPDLLDIVPSLEVPPR